MRDTHWNRVELAVEEEPHFHLVNGFRVSEEEEPHLHAANGFNRREQGPYNYHYGRFPQMTQFHGVRSRQQI